LREAFVHPDDTHASALGIWVGAAAVVAHGEREVAALRAERDPD
jgi:hypothetical protein